MPAKARPGQVTTALVGRCLRQLRIRRGLTQHQLATQSHVSATVIGALEQQRHRNVSLATLEQLARALGVQVRDLFKESRPRRC
jgi:transcriptional regulator with XRE-family HTH domain